MSKLGDGIGSLSKVALRTLIRTESSLRFAQYDHENKLLLLPAKVQRNALFELEHESLINMPFSQEDFESLIFETVISKEINFSNFWLHHNLNRSLTEDEIEIFDNKYFELTEKGKQANKIIIEVMAEYLTK